MSQRNGKSNGPRIENKAIRVRVNQQQGLAKNATENWQSLPKGMKLVVYIVGALLILGFISSVMGSAQDSNDVGYESGAPVVSDASPQDSTGEKGQDQGNKELADTVTKVLDGLGEELKGMLASTGSGGYQGEIISVEGASISGTVKINVSTYFNDSGDGPDGGQTIARKIFSNVCIAVPELESLYVISGNGLESKSVYRSQIPVCQ